LAKSTLTNWIGGNPTFNTAYGPGKLEDIGLEDDLTHAQFRSLAGTEVIDKLGVDFATVEAAVNSGKRAIVALLATKVPAMLLPISIPESELSSARAPAFKQIADERTIARSSHFAEIAQVRQNAGSRIWAA
jgi:hypothetical protein